MEAVLERDKEIYRGEFDTTNVLSEKTLEINSYGVHNATTYRTLREKGRVDYLLLYVESGEFEVQFEGKMQILLSGGFVIYRPGERQSYRQLSGVCYWVHFSGKAVEELLFEAGLGEKRIHIGTGNESTVSHVLERMGFHGATRSSLRELSLSCDLAYLVCEIGKMLSSDESSRGDRRLREVIVDMNKNYREKPDLDKYSRLSGLSRGRFMHVFKNSLGVSPYSYILDLRLKRAAELLVLRELTVSEIAFEVGFSDPLYFSRLFKKKYGVSPSYFRNKSVN